MCKAAPSPREFVLPTSADLSKRGGRPAYLSRSQVPLINRGFNYIPYHAHRRTKANYSSSGSIS